MWKKDKRILFNFDMGSFYEEFPWNFFLQGNPFTFFPIFEIWNLISFP